MIAAPQVELRQAREDATFAVPCWGRSRTCAVLLCDSGRRGLPAGWQSRRAPAGGGRQGCEVAGDRDRTRFIADLSKKVDVNVFSLADPYRVIVDVPEVSFQMPEGIGTEKRGLVTGYRYGLFAPGKSRIVIDVSGPFLVDKAFVLEARGDQPARLVVDLVATDREDLPRQAPAMRDRRAVGERSRSLSRRRRRRQGASPWSCSTRAMAASIPARQRRPASPRKRSCSPSPRRSKQKLEAKGDYEVYLTREDDTFLPLRERVEFAQKKGASLFVSIHAD